MKVGNPTKTRMISLVGIDSEIVNWHTYTTASRGERCPARVSVDPSLTAQLCKYAHAS
jgi:hypothetical protein